TLTGEFPPKRDYETPLYPGFPFFNLIPESMQSNYNLQNKKLKINNEKYLKGYSITTFYLYSIFSPTKIKESDIIFNDVNLWEDFHDIGESLLRELNFKKKTNQQIFAINFKTTMIPLAKNKIEKYIELRNVFEDRFVRVFPYSDIDESLFIHYLVGAIELYKNFNCFKPKLIKFSIDKRNKYYPIRYYAIFNPMRGWISDGSFWIIFRDNSEHTSKADVIVERVIEENSNHLDFYEYLIDEDLIKQYLDKKTYGIKREKRELERINQSRGLLGEFLAAFYILKEYGTEKILTLDVHHKIPGTDIDVYAKTEEQIIIGQVKSSLSFRPEDNKSILENFKKVIKHLQDEKINHRKILFIINSQHSNFELSIPLPDINFENFEGDICAISTNIDNNRKISEIEIFFKEHNVEIIFLDNMVEKLKPVKCYQDLIEKLKLIFIEEELNLFDSEELLWENNYKLILNHFEP
ncbi:MAG: hypothetical protein PHV39_08880, partial [Methanomicrobium sp.]|nr:hypothetical protein [Methanomicrobium sp.]